MNPVSALLLIAVSSLLCGGNAGAAPTQPDIGYDPTSTAAAPCGTGAPPPGHASPDIHPGADGIELTVKQDPNRLCYVYRGIADAPVIRLRQGSDLIVTLRNEITDPQAIDNYIGSGQLSVPNPEIPSLPGFYSVIPGMRHAATGATNRHVLGLGVPRVAPQDEVLETCVDPAVGPARCGRREFTYHYKVPPDMPSGLYWYHPHVHGEVQAQLMMGLAGAIVVEGPEDDARRAAGIQDRIFVVRQSQDTDTPPAPAGTLAPPKPAVAESPAKPVSIRADGNAIDTTHELLCSTNSGTDVITLNGAKLPAGPTPDKDLMQVQLPAGGRELWRIVNAATDAFLDLALVDENDKSLPIEIVARDGAPLTDDSGHRLHPPPTMDSQQVPPSGRIEFLVAAPPAGVKAYLVTHAVDTGCAGDAVLERRLAVLTASDSAAGQGSTAPAPARSAIVADAPDIFSGTLSRKTDHTRVVAFAEYRRPGLDDQIDYYIAERKPGAVLRPYMMGDPPAITVKAGTTEEWVVENWTHELHAFHIHQVHFRVLEINGQKVENPDLLDVGHSRPGPHQAQLPGIAGR
jgi:FtsP/CotA-like multicopper oxidase with cupredoxin domain